LPANNSDGSVFEPANYQSVAHTQNRAPRGAHVTSRGPTTDQNTRVFILFALAAGIFFDFATLAVSRSHFRQPRTRSKYTRIVLIRGISATCDLLLAVKRDENSNYNFDLS